MRRAFLILTILLNFALATWDAYRIGLRRGRAERLRPQTRIEVETPQPEPERMDREKWDANWRLN